MIAQPRYHRKFVSVISPTQLSVVPPLSDRRVSFQLKLTSTTTDGCLFQPRPHTVCVYPIVSCSTQKTYISSADKWFPGVHWHHRHILHVLRGLLHSQEVKFRYIVFHSDKSNQRRRDPPAASRMAYKSIVKSREMKPLSNDYLRQVTGLKAT